MVVTCNSCSQNSTCDMDLKGTGICRKYSTQIIQVFNGKETRFQCVINDKWSQWRPPEFAEQPEGLKVIAEELQVRPKDLWVLLLKDPTPREPTQKGFPEYDLEDPHLDKQQARYDVAQVLLNNYHFLTIQDSDVIYVYQDGIYKPNGEKIIVEAIRQVLGAKCNTYDRNELKALIHDQTLTDRKVFSSNPDKQVCLLNGVLNVNTLEFTDHSPLSYFLSRIPVNYNADVDCPRIHKFFTEIVAEEYVQQLYEIIGYCLYPGYPLHKGVMLIGSGANGKDTFLNLIKAFLGVENCTCISLQQLGLSRFSTSALPGKFANIYSDLSDVALKETGTFKMLTGESLIGAEVKFGKHFTFENKAKLLFSANKMPIAHDDTDAYYMRWLPIKFPNTFTAHSTPKADPQILEKLTTSTELSGLLNRAVKALNTLLDRGQFLHDKPTSELREDIIRESDPIGAFILDKLTEVDEPSKYITKAELHQAYIRYCIAHRLKRMSNNMFSRSIKNYFRIAYEGQATVRKGKVRAWRCLQWSEKETPSKGDLDEYTE